MLFAIEFFPSHALKLSRYFTNIENKIKLRYMIRKRTIHKIILIVLVTKNERNFFRKLEYALSILFLNWAKVLEIELKIVGWAMVNFYSKTLIFFAAYYP